MVPALKLSSLPEPPPFRLPAPQRKPANAATFVLENRRIAHELMKQATEFEDYTLALRSALDQLITQARDGVSPAVIRVATKGLLELEARRKAEREGQIAAIRNMSSDLRRFDARFRRAWEPVLQKWESNLVGELESIRDARIVLEHVAALGEDRSSDDVLNSADDVDEYFRRLDE